MIPAASAKRCRLNASTPNNGPETVKKAGQKVRRTNLSTLFSFARNGIHITFSVAHFLQPSDNRHPVARAAVRVYKSPNKCVTRVATTRNALLLRLPFSSDLSTSGGLQFIYFIVGAYLNICLAMRSAKGACLRLTLEGSNGGHVRFVSQRKGQEGPFFGFVIPK